MKHFWHILIALVSLASVALFISLLKKYPAEEFLKPLMNMGFLQIVILLGLTYLYFHIYCIRWQRIIRLEGEKVSMKKLLEYRLAGFSFSYLTPLAGYGGEPIMAYGLNNDKPRLGFSKSLASVLATRIISAIPEAIFIGLAVSYILFFFVLPNQITFIFYIILGIMALLLFLIYQVILKKRHPLTRMIHLFRIDKIPFVKKNAKEIKDFDALLNNLFHDNPGELMINFLLSILALLDIILMFWFLALSLGFSMNFFDAITIRSIDWILGTFIPVPGNIGVGEASQGAWFSVIGFSAVQGLGYYLIIRAKDILLTLVGLVALFNMGFIKNFRKIMEVIKKNTLFQNLKNNGSLKD